MRELVLNLVYRLALYGRRAAWRVLRPKAIGVRALVLGQGRVLLVRHRGGRDPWGLPGGGINHREPLAEAIRREVAEESGCMVHVERLHGLFHHFEGGFSNHIMVFVCTPLSELRPPRGDLEIVTARYFSFDALPHGLDPGSRRRVEEIAAGQTNLIGPWWEAVER